MLFRGLDTLCTFNGESFDLPVLRRASGRSRSSGSGRSTCPSSAGGVGINGGLKRIEAGLQIPRRLRGVNGYDAMVLWERWENGDREASRDAASDYNADDVINLAVLERRLRGDLEIPTDPMRPLVVVA